MDSDDVKAAADAKVKAAKARLKGAAGEPAAAEPEAALPREIWEVRGPEGGRRRGGLRFNSTPLRVDTADLKPSARRAIAEDPALSVRVVETITPPAAETPAPPGA